jgi:hypothetical protein
MPSDDDKPTQRALQQCADWLAFCLKAGWKAALIPKLEALWWEHHDRYGNLKEPTHAD